MVFFEKERARFALWSAASPPTDAMRRNSRALPDPGWFATPAGARITPFAVYMAFLVAESFLPAAHAAWLYPTQVGATALVLAWFWPHYIELHRFEDRLRAVAFGAAVGVLVFALWHGFDQRWAAFGEPRPVATALSLWTTDRSLALVRLTGVVVLVPIMEELFWRSFLLRWLAGSGEARAFLLVAPGAIGWPALVLGAALFASEHHLLLSGFVAGIVYGLLYRASARLWPVVLAHAATNLLLELWPTVN